MYAEIVTKHWWIVALRALLAIALGVFALLFPITTLIALVIVTGAYLLLDGIFAVVQALRFAHERTRWPMLLAEGILGMVLGGAFLLVPGIGALLWVYAIGIWAVVTGIFELLAAATLRRSVPGEIFLAFSGIVSIVLGAVFFALPLAGAIVWGWIFGGYMIAFGALLLALSLRLRRLQRGVHHAVQQ